MLGQKLSYTTHSNIIYHNNLPAKLPMSMLRRLSSLADKFDLMHELWHCYFLHCQKKVDHDILHNDIRTPPTRNIPNVYEETIITYTSEFGALIA